MEDFYSILNIPEDADRKDIKKAFRELAKQHHPDKPDGDSQKFRQIARAYKILFDPESRNDYDKTLENFRAESGLFSDYKGKSRAVRGKHLKKLLKEFIKQGRFTDIRIKYKGKKLFDISFTMAAVLSVIGLAKAPIIFLLLNIGARKIFEIELSNPVVKKFNEAIARHSEGKIAEAELLYKKILKKSEYFVPARVNLGLLYRQRGETRKAIECFKQTLDILPFGDIGDLARKNLNELRGF